MTDDELDEWYAEMDDTTVPDPQDDDTVQDDEATE